MQLNYFYCIIFSIKYSYQQFNIYMRLITVLTTSLPALKANGVASLQLVTSEIIRMGRYYYRSGVNTFFSENGTEINVLK